jgi:hypothetical protein
MRRPTRPLLLALAALGLTAGTGIPVAMRERGYWADRAPPARAADRLRPSRFTPADAMRLRPGQYRWAPYAGDAAPIGVAIDLTNQRAFVFQGRALIGIAAISSGRRGHGTPTGTFPILEKARFHRSNIYSDAPMPFMQRLTWGGVALHAGYNPGRPASHGCIRLPAGFARILFQATRVGGIVTVTRGAPIEAPPPAIEQPGIEMAATDPAPAAPLAPGRQVAVMSTDRTVAYVTATML